MLNSIDISTSALVAQRNRMNTIAGNIANANTTRDDQGNPVTFKRRFVTFAADNNGATRGAGVSSQVEIDQVSPPRLKYQPGHPDANEEGYVSYPNIDLTTEFINAMEASRAYEANVAAIDMTKQLAQISLRIIG